MVDAHTIATYAFAQLRRDPTFNERLPWVRNTIVCVDSDLVDDVLFGQVREHFPRGASIACYFPDRKQFIFFYAKNPKPGAKPGDSSPDAVVAHNRHDLTMGMVADTIQMSRRSEDRRDFDLTSILGRRPLMAEESTAALEQAFTRA